MKKWKEIVTDLLNELVDTGYTLEGISDEEDDIHGVTSKEEALSIIEDLDESFLFIRDAYGNQHWIMIIPSNEEDCISDYTFTHHLDELIARVYRDV